MSPFAHVPNSLLLLFNTFLRSFLFPSLLGLVVGSFRLPSSQHASPPARLHIRIHHKPRRCADPPLPSLQLPVHLLPCLLSYVFCYLPTRRFYIPILDAFRSYTCALPTVAPPNPEPTGSHSTRTISVPTQRVFCFCGRLLGGIVGGGGLCEYLCRDPRKIRKGREGRERILAGGGECERFGWNMRGGVLEHGG